MQSPKIVESRQRCDVRWQWCVTDYITVCIIERTVYKFYVAFYGNAV